MAGRAFMVARRSGVVLFFLCSSPQATKKKLAHAGNIRRPNMNEKADRNTDEKRTWITVALWFGTIAFLGFLKRVLDRQKLL